MNETDRVKQSPKSREAEQSLLGGLLLDNQAWERVNELVQEKDFFYGEHRLIFSAIAALAAKDLPFDVVTIENFLAAQQQLSDAGGHDYLVRLGLETPTAENISAYAKIVREKAVLRSLIGTAGEIADSAYFPLGRDAEQLLDAAEQRVFALADQYVKNSREGFVSIRSATADAIVYIEELSKSGSDLTGVSTGWDDLDAQTSGLQPGDLIVVAGRPSMGKTAFGMNMAEAVALRAKMPVAIFSLEMPTRSLVMRMISSLGRIEHERLRKGQMNEDDYNSLMLVIQQLGDAPIFIDDSSSLSATQLRTRARRLQREQGQLGMILVDYIQLMQAADIDNSENRATQLSEISRSLKLLAKELNVPIVALSQLNRSLESRPNKRPVMSDIRESGAIEQDADLIMFIYRDEVYNENSKYKGIAEIIIAKQRNGPIGKIRLSFHGQFTRFSDLAPGQYHEDEE